LSKKYFISPCLWFDTQAEEVVEFYTSLFPNSHIKNILRYGKEGKEIHKKPEGSVLTIDFTLDEVPFVALNGTPAFQHNESISLFVYCETDERINFLYEKFSESGSVNMPLDKYDWSSKYAWVKDKFGVSWQLDISKSNSSQKIVPSLLFVNNKFNLIKNAANFYTSIFPDSKILIEQVLENINEIENGTLLFAQLSLNGYLINLMS
jgi:predicted 3-demethylubiquinone-9 3-methyltransferase (glyoxalase superfamily)